MTDFSGKTSDQVREAAANAREEAASETTDRADRQKAGDTYVAANKELNDRGKG
jgi:hypothetical protein